MEHTDVAVVGGGQSGLATAHALLRRGLRPVVLEASDRPVGSWPRYYDSLTLFSPAHYSSPPGMPFPGRDPDRYAHRDEVVAYLSAYAERLDAQIRTGCRVSAVRRTGDGFTVELEGTRPLSARAVVAASGSFGRPYRPLLAGLEDFTGQVLHGSAACRRTRCAAWAARQAASPGSWPLTSRGPDSHRRTASTCVNIDVCRMPRCCRCSNPRIRVWRRAVLR
nr:NAD(P)/FAD-dependent oxidoreductase [Streptomyces sp. NBC_01497]